MPDFYVGITMSNFFQIRLYPAELKRHIDSRNGGDGVTGFAFDDVTHLRRLKSICKPNFNEISESMVEMLLLPFFNKKLIRR